jgi:hypothetical protein
MSRCYLLYSTPTSSPKRSVFYLCDSEPVAMRLVSLLQKAHPGSGEFFTAERPTDVDSEILWAEAFEFVESLGSCDGDFGAFKFQVTDEQKKLVALFWRCKRWEEEIRRQDKARSEDDGTFYIVLRWFEEGYEGQHPVYRVRNKQLASELVDAAQTKFARAPEKMGVFIVGHVNWFEAWAEDEAPSKIAWDADIDKLAAAVRRGNREGQAEIYAACLEWESAIRRRTAASKETPGEGPDRRGQTRQSTPTSKVVESEEISATDAARIEDARTAGDVSPEIAPVPEKVEHYPHNASSASCEGPDECRMDEATFSVIRGGRKCPLGNTKPFWILKRLMTNRKAYVSIQSIQKDVWGTQIVTDSTVQGQIKELKKKLKLADLEDVAEMIYSPTSGHYHFDTTRRIPPGKNAEKAQRNTLRKRKK